MTTGSFRLFGRVCAAVALATLGFAREPGSGRKSGSGLERRSIREPATVADTVLLNGEILVFEGVEQQGGPARESERPRFAEALAIAEGRILFIGASVEARRHAGPQTRVIDLGGRMVMPGIVDGHFHGTGQTDCHLGYEGGTVPQILARLQACLDRDDQKAFRGTNARFAASYFFGDAILPPGAPLTRDDLDRLATTRPILVRNADGHKFWMNSRAIANARIDEKTPDPAGGTIGRDAKGKPNGFFADYDVGDWGVEGSGDRGLAARPGAPDGPGRQPAPGSPPSSSRATARTRSRSGPGSRTKAGSPCAPASASRPRSSTTPPEGARLRERIAALGAYKRYAKGLIDVRSVKIYCDGVMEYPALTAAMLAPYRVNAGTREKPDWRPGTSRGPDPSCSTARAGFVALDAAGWQIHVHAIGDRATRDALDAFEAARQQNGDRDLRHTITHLEAIDEADIPRFGKLGVVASLSLQWARRDAYTVTGTEGYVEAGVYERLFPAAQLWRAGALIAGGSDYPVDPLRPFVQIETAVDRTGEAIPGVLPGALAPRGAISDLLAVVKMHTINAAAQMHQERAIGSLETGKQADLVVLDQNLFRVPTERISDTRVLLTMVGGRIAFDAGDPGLAARPVATP